MLGWPDGTGHLVDGGGGLGTCPGGRTERAGPSLGLPLWIRRLSEARAADTELGEGSRHRAGSSGQERDTPGMGGVSGHTVAHRAQGQGTTRSGQRPEEAQALPSQTVHVGQKLLPRHLVGHRSLCTRKPAFHVGQGRAWAVSQPALPLPSLPGLAPHLPEHQREGPLPPLLASQLGTFTEVTATPFLPSAASGRHHAHGAGGRSAPLLPDLIPSNRTRSVWPPYSMV